ncbi:XRE family transcriptional regulator [Paraburkholderia sp. UYCP14C]|uniref:helix-turn-helix transcriptional regulator n=1 Tax=Paraburkholderia sp. UYCP14C TaxID=2511130 RepID=UPI001021E3CC|nr:helix-turn-helix transcriptional regulator [Paraburkholderia sp. UYCP14C]RZF29707.1 XRE family transcriptional regulator [Paraburkholderia sp. UYCP14C]
MDYAIKTLSQLRPILQGFRKTAGLTQAAMAAHLGVTQQTYAQLEANPAAVSIERLFRVLRVLQVDMKLTQSGSTQSVAVEDAETPAAGAPAAGTPAAAKGNARPATRVPLTPETSPQKQARAQAPVRRAATRSPGTDSDRTAAQASGTGVKAARSASTAQEPKAIKPARATKATSTSKKREDW